MPHFGHSSKWATGSATPVATQAKATPRPMSLSSQPASQKRQLHSDCESILSPPDTQVGRSASPRCGRQSRAPASPPGSAGDDADLDPGASTGNGEQQPGQPGAGDHQFGLIRHRCHARRMSTRNGRVQPRKTKRRKRYQLPCLGRLPMDGNHFSVAGGPAQTRRSIYLSVSLDDRKDSCKRRVRL
jgi:hypothetical protein